MAKTLKDFLNERQLGPMVVKNPDEQKFIDKHVVAKTDDRNGNDDELFKGSKVKMADRPKHRKGYNPGEDEEVYEEAELAESKYEFDVSGEHGNAAVDKLVKHANSNGIKAKVHTYNGPGGGNPVIHLSHKDPKVVHAYAKKHIDPDVDLSDHKINEALKGNQHKIDANKNGKVDAHDFHLLRKKKKVAEEAEELEELSTDTLRNYRAKAKDDAYDAADVDDDRRLRKRSMGSWDAGKKILKRGDALRKEEAEQIDEISAEKKDAYAQKAGKQLPGLFAKSNSADGARKYYNRKNAVRKIANEEAEQIDELSKKTLDSYTSKASGDLGFTHGIAKNHRYAQDQGGAGRKPEHKAMDNNRLRKRASGLVNSLKRLAKEEADQIDEILDTPEKAANYKAKAQKSFSKNVWISGDKAAHQTAKKRLYGLSHPKVAEEIEIEEKLNMDKASMGTVIKDFQKSDAPQFQGKSQKKRQVMAIAAKLSAERGGKPLNKEERLLTKLADISETHKRTMVSVFEKLNEDNQREFMLACDTAEGIEQMLDFSIQHRGE